MIQNIFFGGGGCFLILYFLVYRIFKIIQIFKVKFVCFEGFDTFLSKLGTSCNYTYKYHGCDFSPSTVEVERLVGYVFVTIYPTSRKAIYKFRSTLSWLPRQSPSLNAVLQQYLLQITETHKPTNRK